MRPRDSRPSARRRCGRQLRGINPSRPSAQRKPEGQLDNAAQAARHTRPGTRQSKWFHPMSSHAKVLNENMGGEASPLGIFARRLASIRAIRAAALLADMRSEVCRGCPPCRILTQRRPSFTANAAPLDTKQGTQRQLELRSGFRAACAFVHTCPLRSRGCYKFRSIPVTCTTPTQVHFERATQTHKRSETLRRSTVCSPSFVFARLSP